MGMTHNENKTVVKLVQGQYKKVLQITTDPSRLHKIK